MLLGELALGGVYNSSTGNIVGWSQSTRPGNWVQDNRMGEMMDRRCNQAPVSLTPYPLFSQMEVG